MKKFWILLFVIIFGLSLTACGKTEDSKPQDDSGSGEEQVEKVTVKYEGTSMANKEMYKGSSLSKPSDPSKDGFIFGGWYTDAAFTTEASFPIVVNSDTTIYAQFYSYQTAFEKAREKVVGDNVAGFEFDYTVTATASYSSFSLSGNTNGNAKYSKNGDVNYYDVAVNSGALFYDGTKYQIRKNNSLQKISLDENDVLRKYNVEEVDSNYKFDSSSFAKAVFEYSSDKLKSIQKTSVANEYELKTSMNASQAIAMAGNYINHPLVEKLIGALPEPNIKTGMYVTFAGGELKTYRYEMHIDVSSIKFDLVYNLTFKNVGTAQTITPKVFAGIAIADADIANYLQVINSKVDSYKAQAHSGYDFTVKTGLDFPSKNEINATIKGSALRKVDGSNVFFHNDIEIDSDYKNADLYKEAGISDIHIKKTKLSNGDVYNIEKKVLADKTYLIENYAANENDSYYLLPLLKCFKNLSFIQKITKDAKDTYSVGISSSDVADLLEWVNNNLDLDPLGTATADVKIYGDFNKSSIEVEDSEVTIVLEGGKLTSIEITAKGTISTKLAGSRDFTSTQDAAFDINCKIEFTTKGDSFEPYETVNKAK